VDEHAQASRLPIQLGVVTLGSVFKKYNPTITDPEPTREYDLICKVGSEFEGTFSKRF
jgi:hypothetical protein